MDTTGGETLGRFWADVLGLEFQPDAKSGDVVGSEEGHGIAMCEVPEAKSVKHRVHIDVHAASVDDLVARGASVVLPAEESGLSWTVMADPEGGEFCAFVREPDKLPAYRFFGLGVDAVDAEEIARWWADVFAVEAQSGDGGYWYVEGVPGMPFKSIDFDTVPEPKTVKNRLHWDLYADVEDMKAAGAIVLRLPDDEIRWHVMADPEGNEFCVFAD
ncbi:MAG: VOC family protein [Nocardioidaceae bacterium]